MKLHHYTVPHTDTPGRWIVVYRLPGMDRFEAPVADCPSQEAAQREADRLNGTPVLTRAAA